MPADQIRNRTVGCKMTDSEYERLSAVVESEGMTLGEWCREVLLERADGGWPGNNFLVLFLRRPIDNL